jgi:hypothetical protein
MKYRCLCGYVISDTGLETGDLKWKTESENAFWDAFESLKEYLAAVERGEKDEWMNKFFNAGRVEWLVTKIDRETGKRTHERCVSEGYPSLGVADAISDIYSKYNRREGHSVYRCPECGRLYVQKEYCSDEYICYEKRQDYNRTSDIDSA